ncbi:hypothetical protein ASPCAL02410 [Aspergillus calidoustus]|uniref:Uncharacterized protein n=1 Tax=Aspergillus calidoustus TaxID=454130 RepID=A0A0U5CMM8_ASPCI|nr:hypothetical protein ASPCAL02410 [Aspergillus calidoustus]
MVYPHRHLHLARMKHVHSPGHHPRTTRVQLELDDLPTYPPIRYSLSFHMRVNPSQGSSSTVHVVPVIVTEFSAPDTASKTPARIVWAGDSDIKGALGVPPSLLRAERVHEVEEVDDGVTEVRNWEAQVGVLAYLVRWVYGRRLRKSFDIWVRDLKVHIENREMDDC